MPRFALLEHIGAPNDPAGRHFDLLLEDGPACRTWRLAALPEPGGPAIAAVELSPHRLAWLDHEAGAVSGGRGFARRLAAGRYEISADDPLGVRSETRLAVDLTSEAVVRRIILERCAIDWEARAPGS